MNDSPTSTLGAPDSSWTSPFMDRYYWHYAEPILRSAANEMGYAAPVTDDYRPSRAEVNQLVWRGVGFPLPVTVLLRFTHGDPARAVHMRNHINNKHGLPPIEVRT